MNDPCNLDPADQKLLDASVLPVPCRPSLTSQVTTLRSDWDDLDAAVDYLRALRHVDRVSLVGCSYAGSGAGRYATLHRDKVDRLVFLSPTYDRDQPDAPPPQTPVAGAPMFLQPREGVPSFWDPQVHCQNQVDPAVRDALWNEGLVADAVSWAPGFRRVPSFPTVVGRFLSPKTVEYHLRSIYDKLAVRSRSDLARLMTDQTDSKAS